MGSDRKCELCVLHTSVLRQYCLLRSKQTDFLVTPNSSSSAWDGLFFSRISKFEQRSNRVGGSGVMLCTNWKVEKVRTPQNQYCCAKNSDREKICQFFKSNLTQYLLCEVWTLELSRIQQYWGIQKRQISIHDNQSRKVYGFVIMVKLESRWVCQNKVVQI